MARALIDTAAFVATLAVVHGEPAAAQHVVLITIHGLGGDHIGADDPYHLKIPPSRRLMRDGSVGERRPGVLPTSCGTPNGQPVAGVLK
jgi:hypothetical protein